MSATDEEKVAELENSVNNINDQLAAILAQLAELALKDNKSGSKRAENEVNEGPRFGNEEDYQDYVRKQLEKEKAKEEEWRQHITQEVQDLRGGSSGSQDFYNLKNCLTATALPLKFRLPDMKKFDGTGDPTAHMNQYVAVMKPTILTEDQVLGLFNTYLEGAALTWFHALPMVTKKDWKELAKSFIAQYSFNTMLEVTLKELESTKQQARESFSDFVKRWRAKVAVMKQKPLEQDQIRMVVGNTLPYIKNELRYMPFTDFNQMYSYALTVEGDGEPKKAYTKWTKSGYSAGGPSASTESAAVKVVDLNAIEKRRFAKFDQTYAKVFERLQKKGLLKALTPYNKAQPTPQIQARGYCEFHSSYGHTIENCERLKHEIQDLIEEKKIADPSSANPSVRRNTLPNHRVSVIGVGLTETVVMESFEEDVEELLDSVERSNVGNGLYVSFLGEEQEDEPME
ncbi:uncharacterized protein [Euphorbia lathyris]|uniref:uncharacterized protein n=1 Tax=Euphorbia lathyris TaxID=212925 RepID=UPI0033136FD4